MQKTKELPDQAYLNEIFDYDLDTGELIWRVQNSSRGVKGSVAGSLNNKGYIEVRIDGEKYFAHRIIWTMLYGNIPDNLDIDHRNTTKSDNKINNLRLATDEQNTRNSDKPYTNESGFKGVHRCSTTGRYRAMISENGARKCLGRYDTKEEAYKAYCRAAKELYGEFARF